MKGPMYHHPIQYLLEILEVWFADEILERARYFRFQLLKRAVVYSPRKLNNILTIDFN